MMGEESGGGEEAGFKVGGQGRPPRGGSPELRWGPEAVAMCFRSSCSIWRGGPRAG